MKRITSLLLALVLMIGGSAVAQIQIPGGPIRPPVPPESKPKPKPKKPTLQHGAYYDVTFTCNAPYADMFIDGENIDWIHETYKLKLVAGSHVVELYSGCYNDYSTTINVSSDNKSFHFNLIESTDRNSQSNLGLYYYEGSCGYPQDFVKAAEHFRNAAEQGDICSQANLGLCYELGRGVPQDYSEAVKWYQMVAEEFKNIPNKLGEFYEKGLGVTQSYTEAAKWYKKAAEHGDVTAQSNLGRCYHKQKDYAEAIKWYEKAAEKGIAEAQNNLGYLYWNKLGHEYGNGHALGLKWYQKAAEQGHSEAQYNLGYCYEHNHKYSEAIKCYQEAAEQGLALANYKLGYFYTYGKGVEQSNTEAVKWFKRFTEQENTDTLYNLGDSDEKMSDFMYAATLYQKALEQGDAEAQCKLGDFYDTDRDAHYDWITAEKWYRKAAEQGNAKAQCRLGDMLYWNGYEEDKKEAFEWHKKSAEQGYAAAQLKMGDYYHAGRFVKKSDAEATRWIREAAEQGYGTAQYELANCYKEGIGVKKDKREAVYWYRKVAEQNGCIMQTSAQYQLGYCYEKGWGVEKNLTEAVKWYQKAAEHHDGHAKEALSRLGY